MQLRLKLAPCLACAARRASIEGVGNRHNPAFLPAAGKPVSTKIMKRSLAILPVLFTYLALAATTQSLPPGKGKEIVLQACGGCHALKVVTSKRASKEQWSALVNQMITRGANVDDDDVETVVDYLASNFGPGKSVGGAGKARAHTRPVKVNSATAAELAAALDLSKVEAASIVSYRQQNGNFKDWHDLTKVPGIETEKIESNKDRLVF